MQWLFILAMYACLNFKAEMLIVNGTRQPNRVWYLHRESIFLLSSHRRSNPETRCYPIRVTVNKSVVLNACMADVQDACRPGLLSRKENRRVCKTLVAMAICWESLLQCFTKLTRYFHLGGSPYVNTWKYEILTYMKY